MAVRIASSNEAGKTVIAVLGVLKARHVGELERECATAVRPLVLDLEGLMSADAAGAEALWRFADSGAEVVNALPYVRLLLKHAGACFGIPRPAADESVAGRGQEGE